MELFAWEDQALALGKILITSSPLSSTRSPGLNMSMSILEVTFSSEVQWKHVGLILICGTPRSTDRNRPELHFLNLHAMKAHGMPRIMTIKFHFFDE